MNGCGDIHPVLFVTTALADAIQLGISAYPLGAPVSLARIPPPLFRVDGPAHTRAALEHGYVVAGLGKIAGADEGVVPCSYYDNPVAVCHLWSFLSLAGLIILLY